MTDSELLMLGAVTGVRWMTENHDAITEAMREKDGIQIMILFGDIFGVAYLAGLKQGQAMGEDRDG